jgi:hypothetical protein
MKPEEFVHLKGAATFVLPRPGPRPHVPDFAPNQVATRIIGAIATALVVAVLMSAAVRLYAASAAHANPERALENLVDARLSSHLNLPHVAKR